MGWGGGGGGRGRGGRGEGDEDESWHCICIVESNFHDSNEIGDVPVQKVHEIELQDRYR